jgi:hypothetical protein
MTCLKGRQRKFCSRKCKNDFNNRYNQSYKAQQLRGRRRKLQLIELAGGKCVRCGYDSNFAAMGFHHIDPKAKKFSLDLRSLSNRRWEYVLQEAKKCILMCSNCHAEEHNPGSFLT